MPVDWAEGVVGGDRQGARDGRGVRRGEDLIWHISRATSGRVGSECAQRTRPLLTANLRQSTVGRVPSVSTPRNSPTQRSMVSAMVSARGGVRRRARGEAGRASRPLLGSGRLTNRSALPALMRSRDTISAVPSGTRGGAGRHSPSALSEEDTRNVRRDHGLHRPLRPRRARGEADQPPHLQAGASARTPPHEKNHVTPRGAPRIAPTARPRPTARAASPRARARPPRPPRGSKRSRPFRPRATHLRPVLPRPVSPDLSRRAPSPPASPRWAPSPEARSPSSPPS